MATKRGLRSKRRMSRKRLGRKRLGRKHLSRRKQRGGDISGLPSGYPGMPVSYTPKAADGDLGDPDLVPRVGSTEDFKADVEEAQA